MSRSDTSNATNRELPDPAGPLPEERAGNQPQDRQELAGPGEKQVAPVDDGSPEDDFSPEGSFSADDDVAAEEADGEDGTAEDGEDFEEAYDHSPLAMSRRQHGADDEMDITPMIDITFLLLIFFLVASKMDPNSAVALPKARHGTAVVEKNSVVILVEEGTAETAMVKREDGTPFSSDLATQEEEIRDYVEKGLSTGKQYVLVKAEKHIKQRQLSQVAKSIGLSPDAQQLHIAVMETQ